MKRRSLLSKFGIGIAATGASRLDGGIGGGDLLDKAKEKAPEFTLRKDLSTDEYLAVEHQDGSIGYLPTKPPKSNKAPDVTTYSSTNPIYLNNVKIPAMSATIGGWGYEGVVPVASAVLAWGGFSRGAILDSDTFQKITLEPATPIPHVPFTPLQDNPLAMRTSRKAKSKENEVKL